jgi:hypothetical protein
MWPNNRVMARKLKRVVKVAPRKAAKAKPRATARVSVAVEKDLLARAERYAKAHDTTVAELLAEGLRKVIGAARPPVLPPGDMESPATPESGPWGQLLAWMEEQQTTLTEIRSALGDVAASLPNDSARDDNRPAPGPRIPPL